MAISVDELQIEIKARATGASKRIDELTASLSSLKGVAKGGVGLTAPTNQFKKFSEAVNQMRNPSEKIRNLVSALKPLETIGKSNLGSALNQLKKIPAITEGLDDKKLADFASKIRQVTDAVRPLAKEMEKVSRGFSKLPSNIQKAINANARLVKSNYNAQRSFFKLANIMSKVYVAKRIIGAVFSKISGWIQESNAYVENLNLFTAAMGEFAGSAKEYAETVSESLGIDPAVWLRYQGIFMTLSTGFGVVADKAALMSKNMVQLGYDISSFYNITVEEAMDKLQSGLSGQTKAVRTLGFDLTQAALKEVALRYGIEGNITAMTQAEKAQLRYIAMLTQVTTVQGDLARTLETPANQLRILSAQATQAARALGNIFIPALNAILPYAIAFLKVIRYVAEEIAALFNFTLPEIDYSGLKAIVSTGEDAEDSLDGATGAAKKLKGMLAGFDEINVITQQNVGGGGGSTGGLGGDLGVPLPEYSGFLDGASESKINKIFEELKNTFLTIKDTISEIWQNIKDTGVIDALSSAWNGLVSAWNKLKESGSLEKIGSAIQWIVELIGAVSLDWLANAIELTSTFIEFIDAIVQGDVEGIINGLKNLFIDISTLPLSGIALTIDKIFGTDVAGWLRDTKKAAKDFDLGGWVTDTSVDYIKWASGVIEDIKKPFLAETWEKVGDSLALVGEDIKNGFKDLPYNIGLKLGEISGKFETWKDNTATWIATEVPKIKESILGYFRNLPSNIGTALDGFKGTVLVWAEKAKLWFTQKIPGVLNTVIGWFEALPDKLRNIGKNMIKSIWNGIISVGTWLRSKLKNFFGSLGSSVLDSLGDFGKGLYEGYSSVSKFASGGYPMPGELFFARESGPELVGSMGGRTAVVNNDQIVEAVSRGVYQAVLAASGGAGGDITVPVYIDGELIETHVTRRQENKTIRSNGRN